VLLLHINLKKLKLRKAKDLSKAREEMAESVVIPAVPTSSPKVFSLYLIF
jgi:hypothetical protein